jgi:transposase
MKLTKKILTYHFEFRMSRDAVARALRTSKGTVVNTLMRFASSGLSWPLAPMPDSELEKKLFSFDPGQTPVGTPAAVPDMTYIVKELHRKHVTLKLLWREYEEEHPDGMSRPTFYRYCKKHLPKDVDMKMIHKAGDKLFVDFSGDSIPYIDRDTGEIKNTELYVCSWGASSYTFAEAVESQRARDFVLPHVHAFEFFKCIPFALVPDNLKSAVKKIDRYEPFLHPLYEKMAEHYGIAVLPARVRAPKDKAVVESNVGFVQRYILGRLRNRQFFSLVEINDAIRELLTALNNEPMPSYGNQTRYQRFCMLDAEHARPLTASRFEMVAVKLNATVAPNYHVRFDDHFYSLPHALAREKVDVYQTGNVIEIYHDGAHVTRHQKQRPNFSYTTKPEHMPPKHRFVRGWSEEWFVHKAEEIGPSTVESVKIIMNRHKHPQQGFNSALGILNLAKKYTPERLERAAMRAIRFKQPALRTIRSILEHHLDEKPLNEQSRKTLSPQPVHTHNNIRGAAYYAVQ